MVRSNLGCILLDQQNIITVCVLWLQAKHCCLSTVTLALSFLMLEYLHVVSGSYT